MRKNRKGQLNSSGSDVIIKKDKFFGRINACRILFMIALIYVGCFQVLDIVYTKDYDNKTIENQLGAFDVKIKAHRGAIYDRNNQPLALSSTIYTVGISTSAINEVMKKEAEKKYNAKDEPKSQKTVRVLSELLEIPEDEIWNKIKNEPPAGWKFLKKNVSYEIGEKIRNENLIGVQLDAETKRNYPTSFTAPQLIGFIRGDASWGLEKTYDDYLTGTDGRKFNTFEDDETVKSNNQEAIPGNSLITTLDSTIQSYADQICKDTFNNCRDTGHRAKYTAITVMDPKTGEILAMAQYPTFNLNDPTEILGFEDVKLPNDDKEADELISNQRNAAWRNFNVTDCFEPGSIFKPIVVAMALEENIVSENSSYYCNGVKDVAGTPIPCHKLSGHGAENLFQVLDNSCNIGMMDMGLKLGKEKLFKYEHDFGIGELTGIDLPAESDFSYYVPTTDKIGLVTLATESFGQGMCTSAIQMMSAFSALINGGNVYKPYVVSQIISADGKIVKKTEPEILKKPISQQTSDFLRTSMQSVVESGTAKKAYIPGYAIGAKTGTAQQGDRSKDIYTLSIMGYFPVDDPEYLALCIIHEPTEYTDGIVSPVPMLKELFQNIITYKSIPPTEETEVTETKSENTAVMPNLVGTNAKDAVNQLNALGFDSFKLIGNGDIIERQAPEAGENVPKDSNSILLFPKIVNKELKLEQVPDVTTLTLGNAKKALDTQGFNYIIVDTTPVEEETAENTNSKQSEEQEDNDDTIVYEQVPDAGLSLEKGTTIKLKIDQNANTEEDPEKTTNINS